MGLGTCHGSGTSSASAAEGCPSEAVALMDFFLFNCPSLTIQKTPSCPSSFWHNAPMDVTLLAFVKYLGMGRQLTVILS